MNNNSKIKLNDLWKQIDFTNLSTLSLIFSNLVVIFFAVLDNLSALNVLWIYWFQSVIIGIFNFIKIITLKDFSTEGFQRGKTQVLPTKSTKISTAIFFLFHYGFFHLVYAIFLFTFPFSGFTKPNEFETGYFWFSATMFFISYLVEFVNSRKEKSDELPNIGRLMFAPYARIIPMHLTIILGGFVAMAGSIFSANTNLIIIVLFTGIKTVVDLLTHSVNPELLKKSGFGITEQKPDVSSNTDS